MSKKHEKFIAFINACKSHYHVVLQCTNKLDDNGFMPLYEQDDWQLKDGGKYYVVRNHSSIIAFVYNANCKGAQIIATHSDAPSFKIKPNAIKNKSNFEMLSVEGYGGMICSSWLDIPLSIAGRLMVNDHDTYKSIIVDIDDDSCLIPNVAIHLNKDINNGYKYNIHQDMNAICAKRNDETFTSYLERSCKLKSGSIIDADLYLYNRVSARTWGDSGCYVSGQHLDDGACVFASIEAFIEASTSSNYVLPVFACFDNEEVGSLSYQGASSTFLKDTLQRMQKGSKSQSFSQFCANSMIISADNAHVTHPNHPELSDENHPIYFNKGIVLKSNASMHYTSDAFSSSILMKLCDECKIPYQRYVNRADVRGGSTLGNLLMANTSINCVDVGIAQLAMHSSYESMGTKDLEDMQILMKAFYETAIIKQKDQFILQKG